MTEAVGRRLLVRTGVPAFAGHRRDDLAALVDPVADELRELLNQRHLRVEGLHPRRDRGHHDVAHPLTAPVRPPTIRRSNRLKNTSAGSIDNEVKASTLAVSTEYCDENA